MVAIRNTIEGYLRRTEANLKKIEEGSTSEKNDYFEITQLINSSVGILMWPLEGLIQSLPDLPLSDVKVPIPKTLLGKFKHDNLRSAITNIRHAIAHHNIWFESRNSEIAGMYLWCSYEEKKKPSWVGYISMVDLKILFSFLAAEFRKATRSGKLKNYDAIADLDEQLADELKKEGKQTLRLTNPASFT